MKKVIAAKFGGSSLASAAQFEKVAAIIRENSDRCFIVASAPGKRSSDDIKVTDMLYACYEAAVAGQDFEPELQKICKRFTDIAQELGISYDMAEDLAIIREHLHSEPQREYMASRGEYLNSKLLAVYLGYEFIDAAKCIIFNDDGSLDKEETYAILPELLEKAGRAVIPGFYGSERNGRIRTFSRGGSDVTGAIVAKAAKADMYENWTDVSGMMVADPRIVSSAKPIKFITYRELRELSYMGASVLHEDAVFPCRSAGIPINIRNTNSPADPGTVITAEVPEGEPRFPVTGIAGTKGFSSILVDKAMMNSEIGFGRKVLQVLEDHGISFEHLPSGVDTMSVMVSSKDLDGCREAVLEGIRSSVNPDTLVVEDGIAIVAVVGRGMAGYKGTAARVFSAIARADVNIRMIDQGSSEINIILAVADEDYETAIRAIFDEFMK